MDELVIDNLVYIPSRRAAEITGYAKDYVGQLCREGRIEAKLVGRSWYVLESSIREHRFGQGEAPSVPQTVVPEAIQEVPTTPAVGEASITAEEALGEFRAWAPASYTSETVEELPETDHPTYLTNTEPESVEPVAEEVKTSQIEEVQNAWQEWFSKNEITPKAPVTAEEEVVVPLEESSEDEVVEQAEEVAHEGSPVRISRSYAGSMDIEQDIAPRRVRHPEAEVVEERVVRKAKKARGARKERVVASNLMLKAVFVGVIIVTLAVTIIGTGSLDAISPSWSKKPGAINFLAGVTSFEREESQ